MSTRAGYPTVVTKFSSTRHLGKIASLFAQKKAKENCCHLLPPISQFSSTRSSTRSRQFNTTTPPEASAGTPRDVLICVTGGSLFLLLTSQGLSSLFPDFWSYPWDKAFTTKVISFPEGSSCKKQVGCRILGFRITLGDIAPNLLKEPLGTLVPSWFSMTWK